MLGSPSHRCITGLVSGVLLGACGEEARRGGDDVSQLTTGLSLGDGFSSSGDGSGEGAGEGEMGSTSGSGSEDASDGASPSPNLPKFDVLPSGGGTGGANTCQTAPDADGDGDGFSVNDGDCNDCDANVNPGAVEVVVTEPDDMGNIPEPADEDCDGFIDNLDAPCDGGIALDDTDPMNGARAIDLCQVADPNGTQWGVLSAQYVRANGVVVGAVQQQYGILDDFGPNVATQGGAQMLVLSSGRARLPNQPNSCGALTCTGTGVGTAPPGFPQDVPNCPGSTAINDDIALEVTLRAPTNATGYRFRFDFYSFEYPEWVCTSFNDQFIALVDPPPQGSIDGNISFDSNLNPVSVNIAFFEVCSGCTLGTAELQSTGFDVWDDAGATSWLETTAPVQGGEIVTIRFAIWDTGDAAWDSTVLLDGFEWIADGGTVDVGTQPAG